MFKLLVYGTLMSGFGNNKHFLSEAKLLGEIKALSGFTMIDLGCFPGVIESDNTEDTICGEVYEITEDILKHCDALEGYNKDNPAMGLYRRELISTPLGQAYIYLYNLRRDRGAYSSMIVPEGNWREYHRPFVTEE